MSDRHPTREAIEGLLDGSLPAREAKNVVTHLMGGCSQCQDALTPFAEAMFTPIQGEVVLSAEMDAAYDDAISAALAGAMEKTADFRQRRQAPLPESATPEVCEALLERSFAVQFSDPESALLFAEMAANSSEELDADVYGSQKVADLQARSWAEVANAHRITGDLNKADRMMARAIDCRSRGTGDQRLLARLASLSAALSSAQRRFEEAFRLLDVAYAIYQELGETHDAGRILIARGLYAGYTGDPLDGIRFLLHGLNTIDRALEPKLAFQALHNILLLRVELGEYEQARQALTQMQPLYDYYVSDLERLKLRWVEGKIAAGIGELDQAEAAFMEARLDFDRAGLGYRAALVSLDLVAVWLRQGRTAEIRQLVAELLATFHAVGVEREALVGILLLRDAVECEQATVELLHLIAISLGKLDGRSAPPLDREIR